MLTNDGEHSSFQEAKEYENVYKWKKGMDEEMKSLNKNKTWEIVDVPPRRNVVGNKWVYKVKNNNVGFL